MISHFDLLDIERSPNIQRSMSLYGTICTYLNDNRTAIMSHARQLAAILTAVAITLVSSGAYAQDAPTTCSSEKSHEFDFWIGSWEVTAGDQLAGHNRIEPILGGCVLQENWRGAGGSAGSSLNFFNPQLGKWQQFWVWRNGTTLYLTGNFADGKMTLSGASTDREGKPVENRITWHDNDDGTVRQVWEASKDGGASWTTVFDGMYTRSKPH